MKLQPPADQLGVLVLQKVETQKVGNQTLEPYLSDKYGLGYSNITLEKEQMM